MNKRPKKRMLYARRFVVPLASFVIALVLGSLGAALATTTTFFLKSDEVPAADLSEVAPSPRALPNFDPDRDDVPGLLIRKGGGGAGETNPAKYQMWLAAEGELVLDGPATLSFWSAMKDFASDQKGQVKAFLLDCSPSGADCSEIASEARGANPWNEEGGWIAREIDFGPVSYTIAAGRSLAVKLVVTKRSQDDMWLAYDTASFASALSIEVASPPPPTTTTTTTPATTTTTTPTIAQPGTTTTTTPTTTQPPATTTTTTTPPARAPTTTTTTNPPRTTTTTTTVTVLGTSEVPPTDAPPDEPDPEDNTALPPQPSVESDEGHGGLSDSPVDSLELVIPPAVTSSLLSPLLLLESIFLAFVATGSGLLIPGLLLLVGVLWTEGQRRRDNLLVQTDRVETQP
jgi:hypothetical protein